MTSDLQQRVHHHVDVLAELIGERNTAHASGLEAARDYLRLQLRGMGCEVHEQPFSTSHRPALNLEVVFPGSDDKLGTLVVGAHYDSVEGTPGADDNASAVAILLEIVRELSTSPLRRKVRCVFFDCEEQPHFSLGEMGSQKHARQLRLSGEHVWGMVCLESLGYFPRRPDRNPWLPFYIRLLNRVFGGRNVVIVSDLRSFRFGLRFVWAFLRSGLFFFLPAALSTQWVPMIALSDHRAYWEEGYHALMVTNTALLRNPNYHTPGDRLATLDTGRMEKLCRTLSRCVLRLCT